jgi:hypothetical protein
MLDRCVLPIRRRVAPGRRFGLGLRLSGRAVMELSAPAPFAELHDWLARHDCYVFTFHGGPYGRFQGPAVKTAAYRPIGSTKIGSVTRTASPRFSPRCCRPA